MHVCVYVLGDFRVVRQGQDVPAAAWMRRSAARTLVKLLAVTPDHRLHRERVIEIIWPEAPYDSARRRLRQALHAARRALGETPEAPVIHLHDDVISLAPTGVWIDADQFSLLAALAGDTGRIEDIEAALEAYGGELLSEERSESWIISPRWAFSRQHLLLLRASARHHEAAGQRDLALMRWREILAVAPVREEAHRHIMRLLTLSGEHQAALRQYEVCRAAVANELGIEPQPETIALFRSIQDQMHVTNQNTLPGFLERENEVPLLGRHSELAVLAEGMDRATRGRGGFFLIGGEIGIGKTRLAADAARLAHQRGLRVLWDTGAEGERPLCGEVARLSSGPDMTCPVLLVVDDVHRSDPSSLQLLHYIARLAPTRPLLVLGSYREEDVRPGDDFDRLLASLRFKDMCYHLALPRLSRPDSDRLVSHLLRGGQISDSLLTWLYVRAAGHPLFTHAIITAMLDHGQLHLAGGYWTHLESDLIPSAVQEMVNRRVRRLSKNVRGLLALAASLEPTFTFDDLRAASNASEFDLLDSLDRGLSSHLLVERDLLYSFQHPLYRAILSAKRSPGMSGTIPTRHKRLTRPAVDVSVASYD